MRLAIVAETPYFVTAFLPAIRASFPYVCFRHDPAVATVDDAWSSEKCVDVPRQISRSLYRP